VENKVLFSFGHIRNRLALTKSAKFAEKSAKATREI
jgi:hypothetical protein